MKIVFVKIYFSGLILLKSISKKLYVGGLYVCVNITKVLLISLYKCRGAQLNVEIAVNRKIISLNVQF